jgi:hypothetical protein
MKKLVTQFWFHFFVTFILRSISLFLEDVTRISTIPNTSYGLYVLLSLVVNIIQYILAHKHGM